MEGDLSCKICFNVFDAKNRIPKILPCGHNICIKCLQSVLQTSKKCSRANNAVTLLTAELFEKQTQVDRIKRKSAFLEELYSEKKKFDDDVFNVIVLKSAVKELERELSTINAGAPEAPPYINLELEDFETKGHYLREFDDLRKCTLPFDFSEAFLQFYRTTNPEIITTVRIGTGNSACSQVFVKLCTGETGASYIGCSYFNLISEGEYSYRLKVQPGDCALNIAPANIKQGPTEENKVYQKVSSKDFVVVGMDKMGDFEIVRYRCSDRGNVRDVNVDASSIIGNIRSDYSNLFQIYAEIGCQKRIVDCGIIFNLPNSQ